MPFKRWWFGLPVATLVALVPHAAIAASFYSITDLGSLDPSPASSSYANGINDKGQVVGYFTTPNGTNPNGTKRETKRAFVWADANQNGISDPGEMQLLTPLSSMTSRDSEAEELNAQGQVVGYSIDAAGRKRAVLWQNGTVIDLGTLGGDTAHAYAINNTGKIVGYSKNSQGNDKATAWNVGIPGVTNIASRLPNECQALDVNNLGNVAGMCILSLSQYEAWYYGSSYIRSQSTGINDNNQTVGWSELTGNTTRAFWIDLNVGTTSLSRLGPSSDSTNSSDSTKAHEVNELGKIVGEMTIGSQQFAAIWDINAVILNNREEAIATKLNDRTSAAHFGWNLQSAKDINDKGQIVGHGTLNGQTRAFLLNPYDSFNLNFGLNTSTIYEGQQAGITLAALAPGYSPLHAGAPTFTITNQAGSTLFSGTQTNPFLSGFVDEGVFTLTGGAKDTVGVSSNTVTQTLTVLNVAPTITEITPDLTAEVAQLFGFGASSTDPGINDVPRYLWDLDGDGVYDTSGQNLSHSFTTAGTYTIGLQVDDGDGGFAYDSFKVTVNPSATAAVPEPMSMLGVLTGAIGLGWLKRRQQ